MEEDRADNVEDEESQEEDMEQEQSAPVPPSQQTQKTRKKATKKNPAEAADNQFPCLCCGENCRRNQQSVKCVMCALWAHKTCIRMTDTVFKALEAQQKETGTAYYVCRPCQSFASRVQHQIGEQSKKNEETERKTNENKEKINKHTSEIEELRSEMKKMAERMDREKDNRDDKVMEEMQEREARRLNLVVHGVEEPPESIRANRDRQEMDRCQCEELFRAMRARTKKEDLRFCRRIGEKGPHPRPMVIGLETEEEKRHILFRSRNLQNTRFQDVSIVPDLTRKQRELEDKLRREADERNKYLTAEDQANNLRWIVVGKRGEKRMIKGVERPMRGNGQFGRNEGLRGGVEWWRHGPGGSGGGQQQQQQQLYQQTGQRQLQSSPNSGSGNGGQPNSDNNYSTGSNRNNYGGSGSNSGGYLNGNGRNHGNNGGNGMNNGYSGGNNEGNDGNSRNSSNGQWRNSSRGQNNGGQWPNGRGGGQQHGGYNSGQAENNRTGEQYQQDPGLWNHSTFPPLERIDIMRPRADSRADKRPREQDCHQEEEPARNRGRF